MIESVKNDKHFYALMTSRWVCWITTVIRNMFYGFMFYSIMYFVFYVFDWIYPKFLLYIFHLQNTLGWNDPKNRQHSSESLTNFSSWETSSLQKKQSMNWVRLTCILSFLVIVIMCWLSGLSVTFFPLTSAHPSLCITAGYQVPAWQNHWGSINPQILYSHRFSISKIPISSGVYNLITAKVSSQFRVRFQLMRF